jgi:hypothetical protein
LEQVVEVARDRGRDAAVRAQEVLATKMKPRNNKVEEGDAESKI